MDTTSIDEWDLPLTSTATLHLQRRSGMLNITAQKQGGRSWSIFANFVPAGVKTHVHGIHVADITREADGRLLIERYRRQKNTWVTGDAWKSIVISDAE